MGRAGRAAGELYDPYVEAGQRWLPEFEKFAGGDFTMEDLQLDPGYGFRLEQGQEAIERSAGRGRSPYGSAAIKALTGFSQEMGSQEYGQAYGRRYQSLSDLVGLGQYGVGGKANALLGVGSARAAGQAG